MHVENPFTQVLKKIQKALNIGNNLAVGQWKVSMYGPTMDDITAETKLDVAVLKTVMLRLFLRLYTMIIMSRKIYINWKMLAL